VKRESIRVQVHESKPGTRLDRFLGSHLGGVSRATIQRLIESGFIRVNGRHAKSTQAPRSGDLIEVTWPQARTAEARPQAIPLEILYEDNDLLVLNKAPGMVVHPAAGHDEGTLVNALLHHCAGRLSCIGGVARPGIVHRLDKDTSGCLVVAKHDAAHLTLADQFAQRGLLKIYQAIACGRMEHATGDIRAAIARHPNHRKRMAVTTGGRDAWTTYRVRERFVETTWVEATLHTGRTHQIRVHLHHLGHPVLGDPLYGRRINARTEEQTGYHAPRQMLHAWRLAFSHPATKKSLSFEAPLPADFAAALEALRARSEQ
jgi:23S rRNA pseudouridine1911/1915/1917 synthase